MDNKELIQRLFEFKEEISEQEINNSCHSIPQDLGDFSENGKHHINEMATFGGGKWGDTLYKAAVHGASTKDRPFPHIHIYYDIERNFENPAFNFEISIADLVSKDEINLIYQKDNKHNLKNTHRDKCSWEGYSKLLKGFKEFLFQKPTGKKDSVFKDYLEKAIHQWNSETLTNYEELGRNPMKEYLDTHNIEILDKYKEYFE